MKKSLLILLTLFLCASCYRQEEIEYKSNIFFINNTGRVLEVMKGEMVVEVLKDGKEAWLYTTHSASDFEEVSLENIMNEHPEKFEDIFIYDVTDGGRVLLKKWSIGEREQSGKQLYRLSDSELIVHHERGCGLVFINLSFATICTKKSLSAA